jgi:hypothetical protein
MPANHEAVSDWSAQRFLSWASKTGVKTKKYIHSLLDSKDHPEQAFRTCMAILRFTSSVTKEQMEEACSLAMIQNIYSYTYFAKLIESLKKQKPVIHENLRGKDYYKEAVHVE